VLKRLKLRPRQTDLQEWRQMAARRANAKRVVKIAVVGKYFKTGEYVLSDVYVSVIEALKHAATAQNLRSELTWLDSSTYEGKRADFASLKNYDGILVPGGFGERGVEGKINVIKYARKNQIPFFGLCYGLQLAVIEYARNVMGLADAHTTEVNPHTPHPVIDVMPEQRQKISKGELGGTMRLGAYPCRLRQGMVARQAYGTETISERHRHRYEVNPEYVDRIYEAGLIFSGTSPDGRLMEIVELPKVKHPFFLATQFHPEFKSTPLHPHPLFLAFIKAAAKAKK
jgi:CTP synthase